MNFHAAIKLNVKFNRSMYRAEFPILEPIQVIFEGKPTDAFMLKTNDVYHTPLPSEGIGNDPLSYYPIFLPSGVIARIATAHHNEPPTVREIEEREREATTAACRGLLSKFEGLKTVLEVSEKSMISVLREDFPVAQWEELSWVDGVPCTVRGLFPTEKTAKDAAAWIDGQAFDPDFWMEKDEHGYVTKIFRAEVPFNHERYPKEEVKVSLGSDPRTLYVNAYPADYSVKNFLDSCRKLVKAASFGGPSSNGGDTIIRESNQSPKS